MLKLCSSANRIITLVSGFYVEFVTKLNKGLIHYTGHLKSIKKNKFVCFVLGETSPLKSGDFSYNLSVNYTNHVVDCGELNLKCSKMKKNNE